MPQPTHYKSHEPYTYADIARVLKFNGWKYLTEYGFNEKINSGRIEIWNNKINKAIYLHVLDKQNVWVLRPFGNQSTAHVYIRN